jgi:hypothetical protein
MPIRKYRISVATRVLIAEGERQVAYTIPKGTVITVEGEPIPAGSDNKSKLIEVTWTEKKAMMFVQDLRSRGDRID